MRTYKNLRFGHYRAHESITNLWLSLSSHNLEFHFGELISVIGQRQTFVVKAAGFPQQRKSQETVHKHTNLHQLTI